jgi:hypothetical protein
MAGDICTQGYKIAWIPIAGFIHINIDDFSVTGFFYKPAIRFIGPGIIILATTTHHHDRAL